MTETKGKNVLPLYHRYNGQTAQRLFSFSHIPADIFVDLDPSSPLFTGFLKGISTDGIIPARNCLDPTPSQMAGHVMSGVNHIASEHFKDKDIHALIVGDGMGSGSSRVHAPIALKAAGIQYIFVVGDEPDVVGKPERIFRENSIAIGGPYIIGLPGDSLAITEALRLFNEGETESLISANYSTLERITMESGGITAFNLKRLSGELQNEELFIHNTTDRPQTAVEKIIASKAMNFGQDSERVVKPGDLASLPVDLTYGYELQTEIMIQELEKYFAEDQIRTHLGNGKLVLFQDHTVSSNRPEYRRARTAQAALAQKYNIPIVGASEGPDSTATICHTHFRDAEPQLPGTIIKGSDSHTPTSGVTGALAIGDGAITIGNDAYFGETLLRVPESIKVTLNGELPQDCTMKDVMLRILSNSRIRSGEGIDRVLEYAGDGIRSVPVDDLSVLTNMAVEGGATTALVVEPNVNTVRHLSEKYKLPETQIYDMFAALQPDNNASYAFEINVNLAETKPMIAIGDDPRNAVAIQDLTEAIPITKAYIGSCTGGNLSDIKNAAAVIRDLPKGSKTHVPLVVQPSSMEIVQSATASGDLQLLAEFGAQILLPGCGACLGMGPGGVDGPDQTVFSNTNRNFPGRMGKGENSHVILGSVKSVIKACADNGTIR